MELLVREQLVAETVQLRQRIPHGIHADPLPVGIIHAQVIEILRDQGHVVIAVEAQFAALPQEHIAEILEALDILVARENTVHLGGIIFDHQARVADVVFFSQVVDILPPVVGVKVADVHPELMLNKLTVSLRNRRREVIDVPG